MPQNDYHIEKFHQNIFRQGYYYMGILLYNKLSVAIKQMTSVPLKSKWSIT